MNVVQVYLNAAGSLKLGCLAQAMMVAPKDPAATPGNSAGGMDGDVDGEIDMEIEVSKLPEGMNGCRPNVGCHGRVLDTQSPASCYICDPRRTKTSHVPLRPPLTFQETPAGRKAAHREGKLRMKQQKLQRENACKKVTAALPPWYFASRQFTGGSHAPSPKAL